MNKIYIVCVALLFLLGCALSKSSQHVFEYLSPLNKIFVNDSFYIRMSLELNAYTISPQILEDSVKKNLFLDSINRNRELSLYLTIPIKLNNDFQIGGINFKIFGLNKTEKKEIILKGLCYNDLSYWCETYKLPFKTFEECSNVKIKRGEHPNNNFLIAKYDASNLKNITEFEVDYSFKLIIDDKEFFINSRDTLILKTEKSNYSSIRFH